MIELHGLDTETHIFFYEQDFYPFSNFSSFNLRRHGIIFQTSEHAYHWEKFNGSGDDTSLTSDVQLIDRRNLQQRIVEANSAHEAFQIGQERKDLRRPDWESVDPKTGNLVKVDVMLSILRDKVRQHPYVKQKVIQSLGRIPVENSWRDSFWGWGPDKNGTDMLGQCWRIIQREVEANRDNF